MKTDSHVYHEKAPLHNVPRTCCMRQGFIPWFEPKCIVHAAEQDNGIQVGKERMNHYSLHKS